mgnify:CR=1 FL=1
MIVFVADRLSSLKKRVDEVVRMLYDIKVVLINNILLFEN